MTSALPTPSPADGVIKFKSHHTYADPGAIACENFPIIHRWRKYFQKIGIMGRDPHRYDGAAFGNISLRMPPYPREPGRRRFLVTASQSAGPENFSSAQLAVVQAYNHNKHHASSIGHMPPSSEALTHAALYDADCGVRCVFHVHAPTLWNAHARLGLERTPPDIAYGTIAMAHAVQNLFQHNLGDQFQRKNAGIFSMGGHEDGIITFGRTPTLAGLILLNHLQRLL